MPKIRILSEALSNKIAAGEIVERPASIVKELIENSIDAESTRIVVEISKGGTSSICVSDNGIGMNKDDALLSLERYATSKIRTSNDLFAIKTLGFRGEAIPSIASVSKFTMITKEKNSAFGSKIKVKGGKIKMVSDYGAPYGVMIIVKDLFFNIPARKKFLKSISTETSHIVDTITSIAIAKPQIRFKLIHNGKIIKDWSKCKNQIDRINTILGYDLESQLIELKIHDHNTTIEGWIAKPQISRTTSKGIYIFVNGRCIKDKILHHSLISAYNGKLAKGKYPIAILFIRVPYDQLDVNVHPTKCEVRFLNQKKIYGFLNKSVKSTLLKTDQPEWYNLSSRTSFSDTKKYIESEQNNTIIDSKTLLKNNEDKNTKKIIPTTHTGLQPILWEEKFFSSLHIIGQYLSTYIICESKTDLILIDQHAAHERIVFEELKLKINQDKPATQSLLLPEIIEMNSSEVRILEKLIPHLNSYGFKIRLFGYNTFVIESIPALISGNRIQLLITELVKKISDVGTKIGTDSIMYECLSIIACHNTIRAKQSLNKEEIQTMLCNLDICQNTSHCPHGRPIWIKFTLSDLEKKFGRK